MKLLDGKKIAEKKLAEIENRAADFLVQHGRQPSLAVVLVGDDVPSHLYVKLKQKAADKAGIDFHVYKFATDESEEAIIQALTFLATDDDIDAILIQMPLPKVFNGDKLINAMGAEKDVDGFHEESIRAFLVGKELCMPVFPAALIALACGADVDLKDKHTALIVNSEKFGTVLAQMCERRGMHAQIILQKDLLCAQAAVLASDVVITACGTSNLITEMYIKKDAIVIDGGITTVNGKIVGDIDSESISKKAAFLSPVPGGVGPVTIAYLLSNVVTLAEKHKEK